MRVTSFSGMPTDDFLQTAHGLSGTRPVLQITRAYRHLTMGEEWGYEPSGARTPTGVGPLDNHEC